MISVLVADDQELVRTGFRVILEAEGDIEVVAEAENGREAIRQAALVKPQVVLMDIRMPELDGVEATRQVFSAARVSARERPVRVLVLTTFNLDDRAATAIRLGASGFLLKGATPAQLADAIRTVHGGNAVLAPGDLTMLLEREFAPAAVADPPASYTSLTEKEREVFAGLARGLSNAEIGAEIFLSESTVKTHVGALLRKLGLRDRVQVVVFAHEHGLVTPHQM